MKRKQYQVLGIMSGTSLDGIDLACLQFEYEEHWNASILMAETVAYSEKWYKLLKNSSELSREEISNLDEAYTKYLSKVILQFIEKNQIKGLDAVCSHGHTVLHQPAEGFTIQIGNLPQLAKLIKQKVVCDFRVQDVALGGQGAPLVPIGDRLLFKEYDYCLNLGGFANISKEIEDKTNRVAYDVCPVNTVINAYAARLGFDYDRDGIIAKSTQVNNALLAKLNALDFYAKKPPKSLGIEWVHAIVFPLLENSGCSPKEIIATYTEHVAIQLSENIENHSSKKVLVTGGGAFNRFLIERLRGKTSAQIILPSNELIEFKEALIFGFLGVLKLTNQINVLSSVTGASKNHSSGKIFEP
ncbi:anhydro-N-acetylmuramic acid kinase [Mesonia aestuariivivens]|uniref:Anhydro-N-acetylmuramic acid kinase n=1 Tax=Mesonia aestuariivivens TaxID=2796128 RepID=A0ABS6W4B8_9FLAO|nr:anhydro-N-acetylmuramic acid kinase [Mesonia aestuariivivens]MBW2962721.1 anhydro-N-acetylmuramic acid kinase [Mesonia aestuariivivens]